MFGIVVAASSQCLVLSLEWMNPTIGVLVRAVDALDILVCLLEEDETSAAFQVHCSESRSGSWGWVVVGIERGIAVADAALLEDCWRTGATADEVEISGTGVKRIGMSLRIFEQVEVHILAAVSGNSQTRERSGELITRSNQLGDRTQLRN